MKHLKLTFVGLLAVAAAAPDAFAFGPPGPPPIGGGLPAPPMGGGLPAPDGRLSTGPPGRWTRRQRRGRPRGKCLRECRGRPLELQ